MCGFALLNKKDTYEKKTTFFVSDNILSDSQISIIILKLSGIIHKSYEHLLAPYKRLEGAVIFCLNGIGAGKALFCRQSEDRTQGW